MDGSDSSSGLWLTSTSTPARRSGGGALKSMETLMNYFFIALGFFILVGGLYTSIQSIINSYAADLVGGLFSCASTAV
ncbi:hypothetical protein H0H87_008507 [Tephrocybe sp. NHM501043]|nr:hypothetical protein H0H87_008507 [Tephrocybe sp. NHM501043]